MSGALDKARKFTDIDIRLEEAMNKAFGAIDEIKDIGANSSKRAEYTSPIIGAIIFKANTALNDLGMTAEGKPITKEGKGIVPKQGLNKGTEVGK